MRKTVFSAAMLGTMLTPLLLAAPAQAQATRTWVSGVGDDVNPCSRTAPCKTFAGAISKTAINGEINCLDPGGFGAVTITKSINIDCHEIFASILASGVTGVIINVAAGNANDPLRTVRLRNININGAGASGTVGTRTGINGIRIDSAAQVSIEDCLVTDFTQNGIRDQRTTGGRLTITNTIARNNSGTGILVNPSSGSTRIDAALDRVVIEGNATGVTFANGARGMVSNSVIANNTGHGIETDTIVAAAEVNLNASTISNNGTGLFTTGAGAMLRVSNSDIAFNTTAASGTWFSFGNNRNSGNGAPGSAPTAMGGQTHDLGQQ